MQGTNGELGSKHGTRQQQNEQIGQNSQKFVQISYEIRTNVTLPQYSHTFIHVKCVRNSYEFRTHFVQFANKPSKHTSKHTLQSHGHVIDHPPTLEHLRARHAGAVLTRCHSVVGHTGGATPDMAKWISDSASTLSPLQTSIWCTLTTKKSMHCSPTSMTARSEAGADRERKVGWKGRAGGNGRDRLGGVGEEGRGSSPLPQLHPPNRPLPHPQHVVHAGEVLAGQIPSNVQGLLGGGGWNPGAWCWGGGGGAGGRGSTS